MQEFAALLLLLLLLCPTARGEEGPVTRAASSPPCGRAPGPCPYDAQTPFSDVSPGGLRPGGELGRPPGTGTGDRGGPLPAGAAHYPGGGRRPAAPLGGAAGMGYLSPLTGWRPATTTRTSPLGRRLPLLGLRRRRAALVPRRTAGPLRHPHPGPDCGYLLRLRPSGQAGIGPCFNALPADQAPGDPVRVPGGPLRCPRHSGRSLRRDLGRARSAGGAHACAL